MAFTASTSCRPSVLLAPRASSRALSPRAQALLCRPASTSTTHGLRTPAFAAPAPRRRAASAGIICGKVTKGSVAPNFSLKDQDGKTVSLSKFKGKPVVLYFYPADESPGCTKQSVLPRAFGSVGAPLGSPLRSKRHNFTTLQARISSPDPTPQPQQQRLTMTTPYQESIEGTANKKPTGEDNGSRTCELPAWALIGGITTGVAVAILLSAGAGPASALGPEGPLVEEFWDNMRRYALYALTVSTGFAYALVEPILELLKSPITAVLVVVLFVGGGILVSQVINAMAGNSDFVYLYEQ